MLPTPRRVEPAAGPGPRAHVAGPTAFVCNVLWDGGLPATIPPRPALNRVFFRLVRARRHAGFTTTRPHSAWRSTIRDSEHSLALELRWTPRWGA
jgi:hypothetical protein